MTKQQGFYTEGIDDKRREKNLSILENRLVKNTNTRNYILRKRRVLQFLKLDCQLYRGDSKFPRTAIMTCYELGKLNRQYVLNFISNMDKDNNRPLYRWKVIDVVKLQKVIRLVTDGVFYDYKNDRVGKA